LDLALELLLLIQDQAQELLSLAQKVKVTVLIVEKVAQEMVERLVVAVEMETTAKKNLKYYH
jgi:hypothetical protein